MHHPNQSPPSLVAIVLLGMGLLLALACPIIGFFAVGGFGVLVGLLGSALLLAILQAATKRWADAIPATSTVVPLSDATIAQLPILLTRDSRSELQVVTDPGRNIPLSGIAFEHAQQEFQKNERLAFLYGMRPGYALLRTRYVRQIVEDHRACCTFVELASFLRSRGYDVIQSDMW